jgi:hypothetical protein
MILIVHWSCRGSLSFSNKFSTKFSIVSNNINVKFGENCNFEVKYLLSVKLLKFIGGSCEFYSGHCLPKAKGGGF